jgi:hypothetical protein
LTTPIRCTNGTAWSVNSKFHPLQRLLNGMGLLARADFCDQHEMKIRNVAFIGAVQVYVSELFRKTSILDFKGTAVRYLLAILGK